MPQNQQMTIQDAREMAKGYSSYKDAFLSLAKQNGVDPANILGQLMQRGI